ncbi:MAG: hypothetical protein WA865_07860 [Spirulinaceae cyanobacterium]
MFNDKCLTPIVATTKMQAWIRSRHLVYSGKFFVLETSEYATIESFCECVEALGEILISVEPLRKALISNQRKVILYQAKASLHNPHHDLKQYWLNHGSSSSRFENQ